MLPTPTEITYFVEVAENGNMSRAAERLGIAQPTLTQAIKKLENSLGERLFYRSKRGVTLTPAGATFLTHSADLIERWENLENEVKDSHRSIKGSLRFGLHTSVALYALPKIFNEIQAEPGVKIQLNHDLSRKLLERVVSSELDVALVINPVKHPDLICHEILKDEVTLWCSSKKGDSKNAKTLFCDPGLIQSQGVLNKYKAKKFDRIIGTSSLELVAEMVMSGNGVGILPTRVAENYGEKQLKPVPGAPKYKDVLSLVYRYEKRHVKCLEYFVKSVKKSLASEGE